MSSILTNSSAMVALQTLKSINTNLAKTQDEISTGKSVATAKDSAAVFAITKVMESDVSGFKSISDSLSLGQSTVAVAANGAKQVGDLLNEIKGKIVAANEDNVDRTALNDEILSLRSQINGIVASAQFNGLNLLDGSQTTFDVLGSMNRDASGAVNTSTIAMSTSTTNLSATAGTALVGAGLASQLGGTAAGTDQSALPGGYDNTGATVIATTATAALTIAPPLTDGTNAGAASRTEATAAQLADATGFLEGDFLQVSIGSVSASYTVREGDQEADIVGGIRAALDDAGANGSAFLIEANGSDLQITNNTGLEQRISVTASRGSGGLSGLAGLSVATGSDAALALGTIEQLIQTTSDAQAALGTTAKRLELQDDFMSTMIDSFKSGIGALVDADMEAASARLQALQVQQQLATQALSIANQAPQNILSLFR
ncbi:flagellin [Rhodovulum iodosum]|uniref:Flagellin n=1 Tax=Rhodovulum iodosum TaxID=68291 RepID=A0ABV3XT04_9RHOB|nr:flagellin [Rhodovulum robiginosum]RSK40013.1 flagellin [Rhodovulum robiginosum]